MRKYSKRLRGWLKRLAYRSISIFLIALMLSRSLALAIEPNRFANARPIQDDWRAQVEVSDPEANSPQGEGESEAQEDPRVLVAEVVVDGVEGELSEIIYDAAATEPGKTTTRSQIQGDINAIFETGWFLNVKAVPEDTPLGVRVTFVVQPNPILQRVTVEPTLVKNLVVDGQEVTVTNLIRNAFKDQYGQIINLIDVQESLALVIEFYKENGYSAASIASSTEIEENGTLSVSISEGFVSPSTPIVVSLSTSDNNGSKIQYSSEGNSCLLDDSRITQSIRDKLATNLRATGGFLFNENELEDYEKTVLQEAIAKSVKIEFMNFTEGNSFLHINVINESLSEFEIDVRAAKYAQKQSLALCKEQAADFYQSATENAPSKEDIALLLNHAANSYLQAAYDQGVFREERVQKSLDLYRQAIVLSRDEAYSQLFTAINLYNIASIYLSLERPEQSVSIYSEILGILDDFDFGLNKDPILIRLSQYSNLFRSLTSASENQVKPGIDFARSIIQVGMSFAYVSLGDYQQAIDFLKISLLSLQENLKYVIDESARSGVIKGNFTSLLSGLPSGVAEYISSTTLLYISNALGDFSREGIFSEEFQEHIESAVNVIQDFLADELDATESSLIELFAPLFTSFFIDKEYGNIEEFRDQITAFMEQLDKQDEIGIARNFLPIFTTILSDDGLEGESAPPEFYEGFIRLFDRYNFEEFFGYLYPSLKGFLLNEKGDAYLETQDSKTAINAYCSTLELFQLVCDDLEQKVLPNPLFSDIQVEAYQSIGRAYLNEGDFELSVAYFAKALELNPKPLRKAEIFYGLSQSNRNRGLFADAIKYGELSIVTIEQVPPPQLKIPNSLNYNFWGWFYSNLGFPYTGFYGYNWTFPVGGSSTSKNQKLDCSRSDDYSLCRQKYYSTFIDLLVSLDQEETLGDFSDRAFSESDLSLIPTLDLAEPFVQERLIEYRQQILNSENQTTNPLISEIQSKALDSNTALLEYFLGDQRSFVWLITQDKFLTIELESKAIIEDIAQEFYELVTYPSGRVRPRTMALAGRQLRQLILDPVLEQINAERLLVVGGGILQSIPFGALPSPQSEVGATSLEVDGEFSPWMEPLLKQYEIINLPSASKLLEIKSRQYDKSTAAKELLVFTDPVFHRQDDRYLEVKGIKEPQFPETGINFLDNLPADLATIYPRLPATQEEAEAISEWVKPEARQIYSGFAANHDTALSDELGQYRVVHFATHGIFNNRSPVRSGVVLSSIDATGQPRRGLLSPLDSRQLDLSAADLVVLSGCRTGLRYPGREAIPGLIGNLMSAGTDRVVASLWSVRSNPTKELMSRFYQRMFDETHPEYSTSPAQALRAAQLSMWEDPRWQAPYYWAAFMFQGEWK